MNCLRAVGLWLDNPIHLFVALISLLPIVLLIVYVASYRLAVPFTDEWNLNGRIVIATVDHTLTMEKMLEVSAGHRTFFTNLATVVWTLLTNWNLHGLAWLSLLLALLSYGLLIALFRQSERGATLLTLIPFALLSFTVYRSYNWWSVRHSHWYFVTLFFVLALWIALRPRLTGRWAALVLIVGWCATYSMATGMFVWPIIAVVLWLAGHRNWKLYAVWIVSAVVAIALYLNGSGLLPGLSSTSVNATDQILHVQVPGLADMIEFMFKFVGSSVLSDPRLSVAALAVGVGALLLFAVLLIVLWRSDHDAKRLAPWLAIAAFSLGSGVLVGLGRVDVIGPDRAFAVQYLAASTPFWFALVALMAMAIYRFARADGPNRRYRWIVPLNVTAAVMALGLYGYSTLVSLQTEQMVWGHGLTVTANSGLLPVEQCAFDYAYTRRSDCMENLVLFKPDLDKMFLDELAARRIDIFARLPQTSVLPTLYQVGSPVVVLTSNAWLNVHIHDGLLVGVNNADIYQFVEDGKNLDEVADVPHPLTNVTANPGDVSTPLLTTLTGAPQVWLLGLPDEEDVTAKYIGALRDHGYSLLDVRSFTTPMSFQLFGFQRGS